MNFVAFALLLCSHSCINKIVPVNNNAPSQLAYYKPFKTYPGSSYVVFLLNTENSSIIRTEIPYYCWAENFVG